MTDEELEARFGELEEHAQVCAAIASVSATELVAALAGILIQKGVCTPQNIMDYLDLILSDAQPVEEDSEEVRMGKKMLADSIGLVRLRLSHIEAAREFGRASPTLQ